MELEVIKKGSAISRYLVSGENGFKAEIIQFLSRQWDYVLADQPKPELENRAKTRKQILKLLELEYQRWLNEQNNNRRRTGVVQNRD